MNMTNDMWPHGQQIVVRGELSRIGVKVTNSTLLRWEAEGRFPKRLRLGGHSVGWLRSEIDAYIAQLAAERGEVA